MSNSPHIDISHQQPDLSVVMSVYNNADTLAAAMDSVLSQAGPRFEFIVMDDGSNDGSAHILDEYARRDSRVIVEHRENQGLTRALIRGCEMASAPWIARQDADDVSLPGRFAALMDLARRHPDAVMLASSTRFIGPDGEHLNDVICATDGALARKQVRDLGIGPPCHGCVIFSRDACLKVGGYRACFYYGQDSDLWMRLVEAGPVAYTEEILYCYRLSPGAISGARRNWQKAYGRLGQQCRSARRGGKSEAPYLHQAELLRQKILRQRSRPGSRSSAWLSYYHIGSLLEPRDRVKAVDYFRRSAACSLWAWRPRLKLLKHRMGW